MSTEDQIVSISMNPLSVPTSQMLADVRTFSAGGGDEHPLKVRKPYTITKQRERWAEEEHKMFLEALQLYGRAWRHIEEHIGTKTAVQIRSHAQKFFSKVVRESGTDGNVKSIEIPPPRPKRKPARPYPRKLGNNGGLSIGKLERSLSPMKSGFEQENGSPTSVLSGVGSDTLGSLLSNISSRCASPVTSAAGSNEQEASIEEENDPQLPSQTTTTTMELDIISSGDGSPLKKASPAEEQVPYLKLFGKTVFVSDSNKPSSPPSVMFPMFYPLPSSNFGDITNPADARIIPLPWWGVYGNLSFAEPLNEKECSWRDSNNNASANEGGNVVSSLLRRPRSRSDASVRGFVPYKRCLAEKEAQQYSHGVADDGVGESIGLCL